MGKTQEQMAKKFNISEQSYRNREREKLILKNEMIKFKTLLIEKGLKDITLDDIFLVSNRRKTTQKE